MKSKKDEPKKDEPKKDEPKKETSLLSMLDRILLIILAGIGLALVFSSLFMLFKTFGSPNRHEEYDTVFANTSERILRHLEVFETCRIVRDSSMTDIQSHRYDSIIAAIASNQIAILKRQDDLVNDLRQETNSNIDKTNLQISFWVGIIALLGVFIPLVFQFNVNAFAKHELEETSQKNDQRYKDLEVRLNEEIDKFKTQRNQLLYINTLNSIYLTAQHRITPEIENHKDICIRLWHKATDTFENAIKHILSSSDNKTFESDKEDIIECLIHASATLSLINSRSSRNRNRSITHVNDMICDLISLLSHNTHISRNALHNKLDELISHMHNVHFGN